MLAPIAGGQLMRVTSWRGIFVALAVAAVALLTLITLALRETLPPERRHPSGLRSSLHGLRVAASDRGFLGLAATQGFAFAAMFAYIAAAPFVVQTAFGASPQAFSLLFGLNVIGFVAASQVNGWLVGRVSPRRLLTGGLIAQFTAASALLAAALAHLGLPVLAAGLFALMVSMGFVAPNSMALALSRNPNRAGSASAVLGLMQFVTSAAVAPLVGLGGGGAVSMALVIAGCVGVALVLFVSLARRTA
jgi:DHA1 family bicyclomycin/chloramphenicol resistance-like MFS transporter